MQALQVLVLVLLPVLVQLVLVLAASVPSELALAYGLPVVHAEVAQASPLLAFSGLLLAEAQARA